jgi:hypothetical protein
MHRDTTSLRLIVFAKTERAKGPRPAITQGFQSATFKSIHLWLARFAHIEGLRSFRTCTRRVADASGRWVSDILFSAPEFLDRQPLRRGSLTLPKSASTEGFGEFVVAERRDLHVPGASCARIRPGAASDRVLSRDHVTRMREELSDG